MVLLGDMGQAEAHFDLFAMNVPLAWKSLWAHPMVLPGNVCQVKACFSPF
jgi:hypothetical protein